MKLEDVRSTWWGLGCAGCWPPLMVREVLGHKISEKGIEVDKVKIEFIEQLPPSTNVDRAGVPDLLVRWIILIGGGGDSRDPTTNE
jgi:hypothetical protein